MYARLSLWRLGLFDPCRVRLRRVAIESDLQNGGAEPGGSERPPRSLAEKFRLCFVPTWKRWICLSSTAERQDARPPLRGIHQRLPTRDGARHGSATGVNR
ncbi:unnamed protein product [Amoebophrya sp. A25]|nr:unnamed protein product [Amoebophrya sp. A25]|eukprot:GSA25T00021406001.1